MQKLTRVFKFIALGSLLLLFSAGSYIFGGVKEKNLKEDEGFFRFGSVKADAPAPEPPFDPGCGGCGSSGSCGGC